MRICDAPFLIGGMEADTHGKPLPHTNVARVDVEEKRLDGYTATYIANLY